MESVNILIVEDEVILSMDLSYRLRQMGYRVVDTVDNGLRALDIYQSQPIDLALLDIHILGEWDGIETARRMRQIKQTPLIFLTAMTDAMTIERARKVSPSAYITKPFNDLNLQIAIDLAIHNFAHQQSAIVPGRIAQVDNRSVSPMTEPPEPARGETIMFSKEYVFVKQNYRFVKFRQADILYLQSEGNYTDIITPTHKYTLRMVLNKVLDKFQAANTSRPDIIRIHRSYAVNLRQIQSFSENEVSLGDRTLPIGRSYRDAFLKGFAFM
ncbi:response regulator [Spirosoma taeanense]|uniref:Response regulator n=1 Tax=Spirosoma taeanense TaxID=2735870 RepID=A0A6M5Y777_9BACT|nr:response regulator [Spirosoma taeanense]QJW89334.1 response regulator [Spirosoma taeanense]